MSKRTIEVDDKTAAALELRAAEAGLSVPELLAEMVALEGCIRPTVDRGNERA